MVEDEYDRWSDGALDQCPWCGEVLAAPHRSPDKPVIARDGTEYGGLYATEPADGPFYHPDCYAEREAERRAEQNEGLGGFADRDG